MDPVMLAAFMDELIKIGAATSNVVTTSASSSVAKPAPLTAGPKLPKVNKPDTSSTNYAPSNNNFPMAAVGVANASKAFPPPAVKA